MTRLWQVLLLCAFFVHAGPSRADPPITGSAEMNGKVAVTGAGAEHGKAYEGANKVTVKYTIATKVVGGKTVFDPDNSKVQFTDEKYNWTTLEIPLKKIEGDAAKGTVDSFSFETEKWYPGAKDDGIKDNGIKGSVTLTGAGKADGNFTASYVHDDDAKVDYNYQYTTAPQKPAAAASGVMDTKVDPGKSLDFDPATGLLSIHADSVVATPYAGDPLMGALLAFPDFRFVGLDADQSYAAFWAVGDTPMTVTGDDGLLWRSLIPVLFYDIDDNLFYARMTDTAFAGMPTGSSLHGEGLAGVLSPFLADLAALLDPASPQFRADAGLFMTLRPDVDYWAQTSGFTATGHAGATDAHFVSRVPEPSTPALVALALLAGLVVRRRTRLSGVST
ncbi:PEP-CTERM sorting domain-containing protein [Aquabacterium humicola]|uniref:PEP-CTERM sorting domain-containing protein n=1 Tax=Aquabacterium humicola TaxID=3237377 RepID=UPI0025434F43|nr:PEP-CTERM sorting domain-containing protein [Rubrivivax pictus]